MSEVNFRRAVLILLIIFGVSLVAKTLTSLPGRVGRHPEKKTSPSEREQRFSPPERAARAGGSLCGAVVPAEGPVYTRLRQEDHVGTPMARFFPPPKDIGGREQHPIAVSLRLSHACMRAGSACDGLGLGSLTDKRRRSPYSPSDVWLSNSTSCPLGRGPAIRTASH